MKIFCGKESKSISKIHPHMASHPQNPHLSGHRTIFQMLHVAGWFGRMKSQMKSQKCVCNSFVTFFSWASFFYEIDHNILIDFPCAAHTWHKTKWSCCKLEAVYKQITEISHSLKANGHTLLANPKRPSSTLPPMCS